MAELKFDEDELEQAMDEFNYNEGEPDQGIPSPEDCWELVGSSPSSPLPQASGDVSALEEAMTVACKTGISLQDGYFGCTRISAENETLPLATAVAERQSEEEGHSKSVNDEQASDRRDALVSVNSDTDAIEICATPSSVSPITDGDDVHHNHCMHRDDHMRIDALMCHGGHIHQDDSICHDQYMHYDDDMCHDDNPCDNSLTCHDGHVHHNSDDIKQSKMDDEYHIYHREIMENDERWKLEDGMMCADDDHAHVVEFTAPLNAYHDVCTSTTSLPLKSLDSPSHARMSSHDMADSSPSHACMSSHDSADSDMSNEQSFVQDTHATVTSNELGREVTGHVNKTPESVDVPHGTRQYKGFACTSWRLYKGFACTSWIWTQLSRWQVHFRCANTIWSVALAAALMGILVLGRGWQRLQAQNKTLQTQLWAKEKRITQLMFQLMRTKDSLAKTKRVPVICVKPAQQIPQDHC